jgi:rubrerythrin
MPDGHSFQILGNTWHDGETETNGNTHAVVANQLSQKKEEIMKFATRLSLLILITAAFFFAVGRTTAERGQSLARQTQQDLATAMRGEAFAYTKYSLYANQALERGDTELADLFEKAAKTERFEHFAEEARLAGLVGSEAENLKDAISGESYEVDTMYHEFANRAEASGDKTAASRFEEIRQDEMKHRDAFKAALTKLESKTAPAP